MPAATAPPTSPAAVSKTSMLANSSSEKLMPELSPEEFARLKNLIHQPLFNKTPQPAENGPYQSEETLDLDGNLIGAENGQQLYESDEHDELAKDLILHFSKDGNDKDAMQEKIWQTQPKVGENIALTFGKIVALAGDYYTTYDTLRSPICGAFHHEDEDVENPTPNDLKKKYEAQEKRLKLAVGSLIGDFDDYLAKVVRLIHKEHEGVQLAVRSRSNVSLAYHSHSCGIPTDADYFKAMKTGESASLSFYTWFAFLNVDHFANDAVTCYSAGHAVAMALANAAADETSESARDAKLKEAYVHEAFAAHYLTDLFSSGHLRNPRRWLHCHSALKMTGTVLFAAASGLVKEFINNYVTPGKEIPIWDHQSHYMHDDDCMSGLLEQNAKGHQWISYGDKQLKEVGNVVNLARAKHCLQVSVDEIYNEGFKKRRKLERGEFAALEWIPQPMLAAKSATWSRAWGGYDRHNPAPLWIVENQDEDNESWTYRKTINDHSDFERAKGAPGTKTKRLQGIDRSSVDPDDDVDYENISVWDYGGPTNECIEIQNSSFRGEDKLQPGASLHDLRTGGFIQVQDLDFGTSERTCINFWGPVRARLGKESGKGPDNDSIGSFTLRSRVIDVDRHDYEVLGGVPSIKPMHWLKWWDGKQTSIVRLDWVQGKASSEIVVSLFETVDPCPQEETQVVELNPEKFIPDETWGIGCKNVISRHPLSSALPHHPAQANLSRFLIGCFSENCKVSEPELISVTLDSQGSSQIGICRLARDEKDRMTSSQPLEYVLADGQVCFVKRFDRSVSQGGLLIAKLATTDVSTKLEFCLSRFDKSLQASHVKSTVDYLSPTLTKLTNFSLLTGDVFGQGRSSAVAISTDHTHYNITTYDINPSTEEFFPSGIHTCKSDLRLKVLRRYTMALLPSTSTNTNNGLDILSITLNEKEGSPYLIFRTHYRSSSGPSLDGLGNPWSVCKDAEPIPDNLYHGYKDNVFFHIKWLRCNYRGRKNAVIEVFSWYGVLGMRLFASGASGYDYKELFKMSFMGQTSIGAGLGSYNDWGYGIMSWGCTEDFVDENVWSCTSKDRLLDGSWGMRKSDMTRPNIRGWEVKKRPF